MRHVGREQLWMIHRVASVWYNVHFFNLLICWQPCEKNEKTHVICVCTSTCTVAARKGLVISTSMAWLAIRTWQRSFRKWLEILLINQKRGDRWDRPILYRQSSPTLLQGQWGRREEMLQHSLQHCTTVFLPSPYSLPLQDSARKESLISLILPQIEKNPPSNSRRRSIGSGPCY